MSQDYYTRNILDLKDENIKFERNPYYRKIHHGVNSHFFKARLTYRPRCCYKCGHIFDYHIIKYGFKTSVITLPKLMKVNAYLELNKQRYYCKHCNRTFTLRTPVVNQHCYISNNTKSSIAFDSRMRISECDIAGFNNVSHSTVSRIIDSYYEIHNPVNKELPENLCFDEFKSVKSASGAMSFIYCDSETGRIIDIVGDRRLNNLFRYFMRFSHENRMKVKRIVIDMYKPYIQLIKQVFPRAKIIIDKFHIVQLMTRSLNKTRVSIMKHNKADYTKLKRYWKLILKNRSDVDYKNYRYYPGFRGWMCEEDVINYLLGLDKELRDTYELYQDLLRCIKNKNIDRFITIIKNYKSEYPNISDYMKVSLKTIVAYKGYILNALTYNFNNGVLEGLINKIKLIKRVAFGYRSFYHFKARILIIQGLSNIKDSLSRSA